MRKINFIIYCFSLFILFSQAKAQSIAQLLPSHTLWTIDIDLKNATSKLNYNMLEEFYFIGRADYKLERDLDENYEKVAQLYKNPGQSGIDTTRHLYIASFPRSKDTNDIHSRLVYYIPIKNDKKIETILPSLGSRYQRSEDVCTNRRVYKDIQYIPGRYSLFAWNNQWLIISLFYNPCCTSDDYEISPTDTGEVPKPIFEESCQPLYHKALDNIFFRPTEKTLETNKNFATFLQRPCDISAWTQIESKPADPILLGGHLIYDPLRYWMHWSGVENKMSYKKNYAHFYGYISNGALTIKSETHSSTQTAAWNKKTYEQSTFDPQLLSYFKKDSVLALGISKINWNAMINYLAEHQSEFSYRKTMASLARSIFHKELNSDQELNQLDQRIDSLSAIYYYTGLQDYSVDEIPYADSAAVAEEINTEITWENTPPASEKKGSKRSSKKRKKKKNTSDTEVAEEISMDDQLEPYTQNAPSEEERNKAYTEYLSLKVIQDSLRKEKALQLLKEKGVETDDLKNYFRGDFAAGLTRIYQREYTYKGHEYNYEVDSSIYVERTKKQMVAEYIMAATLADKSKFLNLLNLMTEKGYFFKEADYYIMNTNEAGWPKNYLYIQNNHLVLTNREDLIINNKNGYSVSLKEDKNLRTLYTENNYYLKANIPNLFTKIAAGAKRREEKEIFKCFGRSLEEFSFYQKTSPDGVLKGEFKLSLQNKSRSGLLEFLKFIDCIFLADRVY